MLIFHDDKGMILHIVFDPVPDNLPRDGLFIDKAPIPWPAEPVLDDDGNPKTDSDGIIEYASKGMDFFQIKPHLDYVVDGEIVTRPQAVMPSKTTIVADGNDAAIFEGLLDPTIVKIDGVEYEITGGVLEFTAETPGRYFIEVAEFPYVPWSLEIEAT